MKNQGVDPKTAAATLGSIKTAKKAAASAANGRNHKPRPLAQIPCICGRCPNEYEVGVKAGDASCPRAKIIRQRNWRASKKSESES